MRSVTLKDGADLLCVFGIAAEHQIPLSIQAVRQQRLTIPRNAGVHRLRR